VCTGMGFIPNGERLLLAFDFNQLVAASLEEN
jgi:hypothetical protein